MDRCTSRACSRRRRRKAWSRPSPHRKRTVRCWSPRWTWTSCARGWPPERIGARVLRLDPTLPLGYARDLDVLPNTLPPEKHLGYAVQWFALALAVLATALLLTFRKAKP